MAAGIKISELPAALAANDADQIEVNQTGTSRRLTLAQVWSRGSYIDARQQFGVIADGVTDNRLAIQAAIDAVAASGINTPIWLPPGEIYISGYIRLRTGTNIRGAGKFSTTIRHPASHAFHNADSATTGNDQIVVEDMGFDAGGTYSGALSLVGVRGLDVRRLRIFNHQVTGISVGIGIAATAAAPSRDIRVEDCDIDVEDYGVVIDAGATGGTIENVKVAGNTISTGWGTCISAARNVRDITIENNTCRMPGDGTGDAAGGTIPGGVGFGVKIWQGADLATGPRDIRIIGNNFISDLAAEDQVYTTGVLVSNWTQSITTVGNTFNNLTDGYRNDFGGTGASRHVVSSNIFRSCVTGIYAEPAETPYIVTGNVFEDCGTGFMGPLVNAVFSNNRLDRIAGKGVHASLSHQSLISTNEFHTIGEEAIYMQRDGATNDSCTLSSNVICDAGRAANDVYAVIQLNTQGHSVVGNMIVTAINANMPSWIIGSRSTAGRCLINSNWMYGARQGYRQVVGGFDVYAGNLERGGIG